MRRHPLGIALAAIVLVTALVWNFTRAGEGRVLHPDRFFACGGTEIFEFANDAVVFPVEALGARIDSSKPRFVYALSLFADIEDENQKCVRPVLPISDKTELTRVGEWGVYVESGKSILWCAEIEGTDAVHGLMLFNADAERPLIDAWSGRINDELNVRMEWRGIVPLDEARVGLRGLLDGTSTRGAGLKPLDEAERARLSALEADYDEQEKQSGGKLESSGIR